MCGFGTTDRLPSAQAGLAQGERVPHAAMVVLNPAQVQARLASLSDDPLGPLVAVAVTTGARQGEQLAVRWSDIDWEAQTLSIRRALQRGQFVPCKTERSHRTINLPPMTLNALRRQRAAQAEARLAAGPDWQDGDLVFSNWRGGPLDGVRITKQFQMALAREGLPRVRWHDLRHSCATFLLSRGVSIRVIADNLGHSSTGITLALYAHALPAMRQAAASEMDALLGSG
jgi:integrase